MKLKTPAVFAGATAAVAMLAALEARAETRNDIMDLVVWPCVDHEVKELDLSPAHALPAATIMFELNRNYYEEVIDAVEEAFEEHDGVAAATVFSAGLAACLQNQDSWQGEDD